MIGDIFALIFGFFRSLYSKFLHFPLSPQSPAVSPVGLRTSPPVTRTSRVCLQPAVLMFFLLAGLVFPPAYSSNPQKTNYKQNPQIKACSTGCSMPGSPGSPSALGLNTSFCASSF